MVVENKKITVIPVPVPVLVQVFSLVTVEKKHLIPVRLILNGLQSWARGRSQG